MEKGHRAVYWVDIIEFRGILLGVLAIMWFKFFS